MKHAYNHKPWIVMDSRLQKQGEYALASEAYTWREVLAKRAKADGKADTQFTVAYLPSPFSIQSHTLIGENGVRITYAHRRKG